MGTHHKLGLALASTALVAIASTTGCNAILGIDGEAYADVAVEMCKCEGIEFAIADCQTRVRDSLAEADPEVRERWLAEFDTRDCDVCGSPGIFTCLQEPPVCRGLRERCEGVLECCGIIDEERACIDGRCAACIPPNDPSAPSCTKSSDCCGGLLREGEVYCHEGRCVEQAPTCRHSFDTCSGGNDCCGAEAAAAGVSPLAACSPTADDGRSCFEACSAGGANCPGCCARVEIGNTSTYVCLDGPATAAALEPLVPPGATACEALCELGVDEQCPDGTACSLQPLSDNATVHFCVPVP